MKRTSKAKTTRPSRKTTGATSKAAPHKFVHIFRDTAPLLMALAVVDLRPSDDADDFGSVWQSMAEQQLGWLSSKDRKACFERAEMILALMLTGADDQ